MSSDEPSSVSTEEGPAARPLSVALIAQAAALGWLLAVIILYLRVSQFSFVQFFEWPGLPAFAAHLARIAPLRYGLDLLGALIGAAAFSLASLSLGLRILHWLKVPPASRLAYGTTAFVVGEILFSLLFLTLISLYKLTPAMGAAALALGFLIGFTPLKSFARGLPRPPPPPEFRPDEKILLGLVLLILASGLLMSSARLGYDAVTQYFSHAKIMAMSGQGLYFHPDPFLVSSLPPGLLFTSLIQLFGDQAARMLPWLNGLAIVLMGLAIAGRLGLSRRSKLWFLLLMVTSTAFLDLLGDGKIEIIATAPILTAVYWMLVSIDEPSGSVFGLIGFLAGFAMISRPYNIPLVGLFMLLLYAGLAFVRWRSRQLEFRPLIRSALWMLPPLLALGSFYLLQAGLWRAGPRGEVAAVASVAAGSAGWQWQIAAANVNWYRLLYPLSATFSNTPQSLGTISPLFVGFLALALARNARQNFHLSPDLLALSVAAIITLLAWITLIYTVLEIRYVWFLWVLIYIPAAQVFGRAMERSRGPIWYVASALLVGLLVYMAGRTVVIALDTYSPVDRNGQAHCYDVETCKFLDPLNASASPGRRVFVLNAYRYYLRPDLFACSSRADEFQAFAGLAGQNSPDFWVELYRQGFDFITYEPNFAEFHTHFGPIPDPKLAPDWLRVSRISEFPETGDSIYRITAVDPPFQPEKACVQSPGKEWLVQGDR